MKKIILIPFLIAALLFNLESVFSQELKYCGTTEEYNKIKENPELFKKVLESEKLLEEQLKNFSESERSGRGTVYVIPVVFHIVHDYGTENISDAQVRDAVRILNEDFRKLNADTSNIVAAFKSIAGDAEIEFRLAQRDPQGNCTNGITRTPSLETNSGQHPGLSNLIKWPRDKYMNVWVVKAISSGAAGYTNYPSVFDWQPDRDGIVILHSYIGSIGTGSYSRGRALTHEIGHWLNLPHTWGSTNNPGVTSNCSSDDGVNDTPNTEGWTVCNLNGETCGTLDNVQNYMDYSYCSNMFTNGQISRMRAALTSSVAQRSSLYQQSNIVATGVDGGNLLCKAEFEGNRTIICEGQSVEFNDLSYNLPTSWNWTFTGGSPANSTSRDQSVSYSTPGTYSVQLNVSDGSANQSATKTDYIRVLSSNGVPVPISEGFESITAFPSNEWFVFNPDGANTWTLANTGASGSKSVRINNSGNVEGREDELISSTIDLSGLSSVNISFKVAFAKKVSSNNDQLKFMASTNCGQTWSQRWSKSGTALATAPNKTSSFIPSDSTQWQEFVLTSSQISSALLVKNFRFKFVYVHDGGNNIYIDDINIYDPSTVGVEEQNKTIKNLSIYPNPFLEETIIEFSIYKSDKVSMILVDILGKEFILLPENQILQAGEHKFTLNKNKMNLSNGVYFIRFSNGTETTVKKLVVQ